MAKIPRHPLISSCDHIPNLSPDGAALDELRQVVIYKNYSSIETLIKWKSHVEADSEQNNQLIATSCTVTKNLHTMKKRNTYEMLLTM